MFRRVPIAVVMLLLLSLSETEVQGDIVGHWTFDDVVGTTVPDSAGGDDAGTLTGAVSVVPSYAPVPAGTTSALSFAGVRAGETTELSLVDTGNLSPGTGAWSFEAWINPTNVFPTDDSGRQLLYNDFGASPNVVQIYLTNDELSTYWRDGAGVDIQFTTLGAGLQAFTWQHVKLERTADTLTEPGNLNFYVNGNPVVFGTTPLPASDFNVDTSGGRPPIFGHHGSAGPYWVYNGEMDDVVINGTLPPAPLPGDANDDKVVDDKDASILGSNWLTHDVGWAGGDFNDDGIVNDNDAAIMAAHWTQAESSAPPSVPEPSTIILLVVGGLIMLVRLPR